MPKFPKAARFILTFLAVYFVLVLTAGMTGFRSGFTQSFMEWATEKYKGYLPHTETSFMVPRQQGSEHDTIISLLNAKTKPAILAAARQQGLETANLEANFFNFSVWDYFLLQFIVLISLVLASPISWKRKGISFMIGAGVLALFTFHRFHCTLKYYGMEAPLMEPMGFSSFTETYVKGLFKIQSIEFIFISTFIIWALSTIRKRDVEGFLGQG